MSDFAQWADTLRETETSEPDLNDGWRLREYCADLAPLLDRAAKLEARAERYETALSDITAMSDLPAGGHADSLVRGGIVEGWQEAVDEARSIAAHAFREPDADEEEED